MAIAARFAFMIVGTGTRRLAQITTLAVALLGTMATGRAAVLSPTASLPLLGVPYITTGAAGCFPLAGVCVGGGSVTLTSLISSSFDATGQRILTTAAYDGVLTTLGGVPVSAIALTGTFAQDVLGRSFDGQTGSWTTLLTAASLTGPVLGRTLTLALSPTPASSGVSSVTPVGSNINQDDRLFRIDSFFDLFVTLSLDGVPPLNTTRGPLRITATAVPEPAGLAVLTASLLGLAAVRRRQRLA